MNAPQNQRRPQDRPHQSVAQELRDDLLSIIQRHFYRNSISPNGSDKGAWAEHRSELKAWEQDRTHLLRWVVLWPAGFITGKGFTLPGPRYKQIFSNIILEAVRHGNTSKLKFRPAWLKMVVQSHFRTHWEEYYAEAKSARAQADHALHVLGQLKRVPDADPVRDLAAAAALLARTKRPKKTSPKPLSNLEFKL